MTRIAVGGFLHETNTFAPTKASYDAFVHGGGFPRMEVGGGILQNVRRINVGLAGFIEQAETEGWELVPTIFAAATPSAHVTEDAFERIARAMIDGLASAGKLDAVYLDLHGAMVSEHHDDGEGEILARVRKAIGNDVPLVASLDLHANITPEMVAHADALIAYRTYPHVDMAETGRACARHLALLLKSKQRLAKAFRQTPFLIPISWQCTNDEPAKGIYRKLASLESEAVPTLSFAFGFPAADFVHCGPSIVAYGRTQADADAAADAIAALVESHEDDFDGKIWSPDEGVRHAMELAKTATRPIVIADTQDNPGAGGDSDTTGMLRALVRNNAERAATGIIYDPQAAKAARRFQAFGDFLQVGLLGGPAHRLAQAVRALPTPPLFLLRGEVAALRLAGPIPFQVQHRHLREYECHHITHPQRRQPVLEAHLLQKTLESRERILRDDHREVPSSARENTGLLNTVVYPNSQLGWSHLSISEDKPRKSATSKLARRAWRRLGRAKYNYSTGYN